MICQNCDREPCDCPAEWSTPMIDSKSQTRFIDWDFNDRMTVREAVENENGGHVVGYVGDGWLQVAYARGLYSDTCAALRSFGLEPVPDSLIFFPLGTDNPHDNLRHDGRYPGSRGFWLYECWRPVVK